MKKGFSISAMVSKLLLLLIIFPAAKMLAQYQFEVTEIVVPGETTIQPYDINDKGQVVAEGYDLHKTFLWDNGNVTFIENKLWGLNDSTQVVGAGIVEGRQGIHAFVWENGFKTTLIENDVTRSEAWDINEKKQIVGYTYDPAGITWTAFLWENNVVTDLGVLSGTNTSLAYSINERDQIVGYSQNSVSYLEKPFLWEFGQMKELPTWGGNRGRAWDINNLGQIVGGVNNASGIQRACLWQDGNIIDLGGGIDGGGIAYSINDKGQIVGGMNAFGGFIWQNGNLYALNDLLEPGTGWDIRLAYSINEKGQITGYGFKNGTFGAFILNPKTKVISPKPYYTWIAGETDTIEWIGTNWSTVNIKLVTNVGTPIESETILIEGLPNSSQKSVGKLAGDFLSYRSKFIIENADNPSEKIESDIFRIKPYVITKVQPDSTYYEYKKNRDQWNFINSRSQIWPSDWYEQFDYRGIDPFTNNTYPFWLADFVFLNALKEDFPDWISFVNAFGVDACYFNPVGSVYSMAAAITWESIKGKWGGSCFGIAGANAFAFSHKQEFQNKYPNFPDFINPIEVVSDTGVKRVVNELFAHQFGYPSYGYDDVGFEKTPTQTLNEIKEMLKKDNVEARLLAILSNGLGGGGHSVVPHKLQKDPNQESRYDLFLYDNAYPELGSPIKIYTNQNDGNGYWYYEGLADWAGYYGLYLDVSAESFLNNATFDNTTSNKSSFILADNDLQINYPVKSQIKIIDEQGNISGYVDSLIVSNIPGSFARRIKNGIKAPPYGYSLPTENYSIELNNFDQDTVQSFFFTGNKTFIYGRSEANQSETDRLFFDGGLSIINPDTQTKTVKLSSLINETTQEKFCVVRSLNLVQNDSVKIENVDEDKIKLISCGSPKKYDIELNYVNENSIGRFGDFNITLSGNTSHTIIPNWRDITNTQLEILVDNGNDGTIDDTLMLDNKVTGIGDDEGSILTPNDYHLSQNYPNPFNPTTKIRFHIPNSNHVSLKVYDILGKEIATLVNEYKQAGDYEVEFNPASGIGNLASGIYFYTLTAGEFRETKKMLLLK